MFNIKTILLCILISCYNDLLFAQPLSFNHLTTYDGLSQNAILSIAQDYRGFMWFGTGHGLNRYDGVDFKKYFSNPSDEKSISGDYVMSLLADSKKTLWVGTSNGLNKLDIETNSIERISASGSDTGVSNTIIRCMYEDRGGNIWIGTNNGLNLLTDRKKNFFTKFYAGAEQGIAGNVVTDIFEDDESALWVGTNNGLTRMTNKNDVYQFETFRHGQNNDGSLSFNEISAIAEDASHNIWVGTPNNGLNVFDKNKRNFSQVTMAGVPKNMIMSIKNYQEGKLWIGTDEGVYILDPLSRDGNLYQHVPSDPNSLNQNFIMKILFDALGSAWIGTYYGGINVAHPYNNSFSIWQKDNSINSISENVVSGITEDEKQNLWISMEGGGLNCIERQTGKITRYFHDPKKPETLGSNQAKMVYTDKDGEIWAGTTSGGLNLFNPGSGSFTHFIYDPANLATSREEIHMVLEDSQERFWVAAQHGVKLFRKTNRSLLPDTSINISGTISFDYIFSVIEDSKKNIWVGGVSGLYMLKKHERKFNVISGIPGTVNCIAEDRKGNIWVGRDYNGLVKYDPATGKIIRYNIGQNGLGNDILGLLEDGQDNLWIATDIGLCRFNTIDSTFRFFNPGNKMIVGGNVRNSCYKSKTGEFFFGGTNGFLSFFPDKIQMNKYIAPLMFTSLRLLNNQSEGSGSDQLLTKDISLTDKIQFRHNQNAFMISFALLSYINAGDNKYAYKLDGLDKDWIQTNNTSIIYPYLPTGKYTLLVKGANSDGLWSKPTALSIEIMPVVWETWWAYLIYISLLTILIFFIVTYFSGKSGKSKK